MASGHSRAAQDPPQPVANRRFSQQICQRRSGQLQMENPEDYCHVFVPVFQSEYQRSTSSV